MSECNDPDKGKLLLAYELNALPEDKIESIEMHIMECEHCFNELIRFEREAGLLSSDSDVKSVILDYIEEEHPGSDSLFRRWWQYLWPKTPVIFRPAFAYCLILLLVFPVYRGLRMSTDTSIGTVQTLRLLPGRSVTEDVLKVDVGDYGLLSFVFRGATPGREYQISILSADGDVLFRDDAFDSFDEYETGKLLLRLANMEPGAYRLLIADPRSEHPPGEREYSFRIEN